MDIANDKHNEITEALYNIQAVARLIECAFEHTDHSTKGPGAYGGACLIQREVKRVFDLIGEQ